MKIESFLISDAATDQNGKLYILGAFDTINTAADIPSIHPQCSVSIRIRFNRDEIGKHSFENIIISPNGTKILEVKGELEVVVKEDFQTGTFNLVFNIRDLKCIEYGEHTINLKIDDSELGSIVYYVKKIGA
jgi:hypothetical protein